MANLSFPSKSFPKLLAFCQYAADAVPFRLLEKKLQKTDFLE